MRKWISVILMIGLAISLWGCSEPAVPTQITTLPQETTAVPTMATDTPDTPIIIEKPLTAVSVPHVTETNNAENGTVLFNYTYPHMALVMQDSDVADKIILDFLNRVDSTAEIADQLRQSATANYNSSQNWIPYLCQVQYEPARIDQGVLSLSGTISTYSGGMHPEHTNMSANYDMLTGDILTLGSIMHMDASTQDFCELVLEELSPKAQELYLYSDYEQGVAKRFTTDESNDEGFYFTTIGLCFYFSPYEIAPYSSGTITVEIPYEKLVGVIHDAYFPGEKHPTNSVVNGKPMKDANMEEVGQISEAILTPGGEMYLLTSENLVENVQLQIVDNELHAHTFFAAENLSVSNAIVIEATPEQLAQIRLIYENAEGIQITQLP